MRSKFDEQLLELNKEMIEMGNKIIESIKNAIDALVTRNEIEARTIMEGDERTIREFWLCGGRNRFAKNNFKNSLQGGND